MDKEEKRGGAREGAGRPKGIRKPIARTRLIAEAAALKGITPLEVILENMRYYHNLAEEQRLLISGRELIPENKESFGTLTSLKNMAQNAAKDASPYIHPRLANVEANVTVTGQEAALTALE